MKQIVSIADMKITDKPDDILVTFALGSCLGIAVYDPVSCVGGLLHVMLPQSSINEDKAVSSPYMFVDTGIPKFFHECYKVGARKDRLKVYVAGGAKIGQSGAGGQFDIGRRNCLILKKLFWRNNVFINAIEVGGNHPRTMTLDMDGGIVTLKTSGVEHIMNQQDVNQGVNHGTQRTRDRRQRSDAIYDYKDTAIERPATGDAARSPGW